MSALEMQKVEPAPDAVAAKALVERVKADAAIVFGADFEVGAAITAVRLLATSEVADLSTAKGRDRVKSMAHAVVKIKTAVDEAGKAKTEDLRKAKDVVDRVRKRVRDELDTIRDEVRRPLDQWEAQEEARVEQHRKSLAEITGAATIHLHDDAAGIRDRIASLEAIDLSRAALQEYAEPAQAKREATLEILRAGLAQLEREEVERAELAKLRQEATEREERDRAEREQREAAEKAAATKKAREEREAAAAAERERIAQEAAAAAKREAEERHRAALAEQAAAAEREGERIRAEHRAAEQAREEADRKRQEEVDRAAAEQARREADEVHRANVIERASAAIAAAGGISKAKARVIFLAADAGEIPHLKVQW